MVMSIPTAVRRYTVPEVYAFPEDGNRYEVVHGELLVTPAPTRSWRISADAPECTIALGEVWAALPR